MWVRASTRINGCSSVVPTKSVRRKVLSGFVAVLFGLFLLQNVVSLGSSFRARFMWWFSLANPCYGTQVYRDDYAVSSKSRLSRYSAGNDLTVLVTITGAWVMPIYRTKLHALYLDLILENYVAICESGFLPTIILITGNFSA